MSADLDATNVIAGRLYDLLDKEEPPTLGMSGRLASWPLYWAANTVKDITAADLVIVRRSEHVKAMTIANTAGDLWNELENLREHWVETPQAALIEEYIANYERAAGIGVSASPESDGEAGEVA